MECPICYKKNVNMVILTCKHNVCLECCIKSKINNLDNCSLCRDKIEIKIFDNIKTHIKFLNQENTILKTEIKELENNNLELLYKLDNSYDNDNFICD